AGGQPHQVLDHPAAGVALVGEVVVLVPDPAIDDVGTRGLRRVDVAALEVADAADHAPGAVPGIDLVADGQPEQALDGAPVGVPLAGRRVVLQADGAGHHVSARGRRRVDVTALEVGDQTYDATTVEHE